MFRLPYWLGILALSLRCLAQEPCADTKIEIRSSSSARIAKARADLTKPFEFKVPILIGSAEFRSGNKCTVVQASYIDDFFDGLRRVPREKLVFLKDDRVVENLPEKTTIEIDPVTVACEIGKTNALSVANPEPLRFEVLSGSTRLNVAMERDKAGWTELSGPSETYFLTVETAKLPMQSRLQINVYQRDEFVGCLYGGL